MSMSRHDKPGISLTATILILLIYSSRKCVGSSSANYGDRPILQEPMDTQIFTESSNNMETDDEVQKVLKLLKEGEALMKFQPAQNAIMLMGNTGSGKSTFSQFITGNDKSLISVETVKRSGEYILEDIFGKVSTDTWTSRTIYPELHIDNNTSANFYDCPGFSDTRGVAHDITATYFTKKTITKTQAVKLVFIVGYPAVRVGVDRQDFMMFAEHVAKAVRNIDKFRDSLALVVTKVDNFYRDGTLVGDETVIETIVDFLQKLKNEIISKLQSNGNHALKEKNKEREKNLKIITFIEILLQKDGNYYPRIGIFRRPDRDGPITKMAMLQESKRSLERIVHKNIKFIEQTEADFDYTISAHSKYRIYNLVEIIRENIVADVRRLTEEIEKGLSAKEEKENDIEDLRRQFQEAHDIFTKIIQKVDNLNELTNLVTESMHLLNLTISKETLVDLSRYDSYLEFLNNFSATVIKIKPSEWNQNIIRLNQRLKESKCWYAFLTEFSSAISSYDVQRDPKNCVIVADKLTGILKSPKNFTIKDINDLRNELHDSCKLYSGINHDKINEMGVASPVKFQRLELLIDLALKFKINLFCDKVHSTLRVKGYFVKISDALKPLEDKSCKNVLLVEIFALKKVFIDSNVDLTGEDVQISIISPTWIVVNSPKIVLDGSDAVEIDIAPMSDTEEVPGNPGLPGGPAGNFLGIGDEFVNCNKLSISASGGRGGRGQKGKDGVNGNDGTTPSSGFRRNLFWPEKHSCQPIPPDRTQQTVVATSFGTLAYFVASTFFGGPLGLAAAAIAATGTGNLASPSEQQRCKVIGTGCSDGENGGNGGAGGKGGMSGRIEMIALGTKCVVSRSTRKGEDGTSGLGGNGGTEGEPGEVIDFLATKKGHFWEIKRENSVSLSACKPGKRGIPGHNFVGLQEPQSSRGLIVQQIFKSLTDFVMFAKDNLDKNVWKTHLKMFLCDKLKDIDKKFKYITGVTDIMPSECFINEPSSSVPNILHAEFSGETSSSRASLPSRSPHLSVYFISVFLILLMTYVICQRRLRSNEQLKEPANSS
nr:PREDICTED: uncharacterized protein LOC109031086 [Bemisia tabaci]